MQSTINRREIVVSLSEKSRSHNILVLNTYRNPFRIHIFWWRNARNSFQHNENQSNNEDQETRQKSEPAGPIDASSDESVDLVLVSEKQSRRSRNYTYKLHDL